MVSRFLITTADERTWRFDRPVLFLGEWCRLYDRRSAWENLDSEVVPYHWDDRSKLYKDYLYLRDLYENLLVDLSEALNRFHKVNHSGRYWRILVGPWLGYFIQIIFDRWTMIQQAVHNFEIGGSAMLALSPNEAIPNDMNDFVAKFIDDRWNSFIYGQILTSWTNLPCKKVSVEQRQPMELGDIPEGVTNRSLLRRLGAKILEKVFHASFLSRHTDAFFISTYLTSWINLWLQISLGQTPKHWISPPVPETRPNLTERERVVLSRQSPDGFEHCVRSLIPMQLPTSYLEGFEQLQTNIRKLPWPKKPRVIFTSSSHIEDDVFKAWTSNNVENGSKLIIGQHGGHYGTGLWNSHEDHELSIADRYLTWGWMNDEKKHCPVGILKLIGKRPVNWNPDGGILVVTSVSPRWSYFMYSAPVASQVADYFQDLFMFVSVLPDNIRRRLKVRLYSSDYRWSQTARWKDSFPDVTVDKGVDPIKHLIKDCRIYVSTYNATTFLETLAQNVPTIMFWNPNHWELRCSAEPFFDLLKQIGIFHETPKSAALKIAQVWDNVKGWWNQPDIQEARRYFCDQFARVPAKPMKVLREALATVSNNNNL